MSTADPIGANVFFSRPAINGSPGAKQFLDAFSGLKLRSSIKPKNLDSLPIIAADCHDLSREIDR